MKFSTRTKGLIFLGLVLVLLGTPILVHAFSAQEFINDPISYITRAVAKSALSKAGDDIAKTVTEVVLIVLVTIKELLVSALTSLGKALDSILNLFPSTGGPVVDVTWKFLRDFFNMGFIVILIVVSFATIFNTFSISFLKPYYLSRTIIINFLIAAIFMNFSMAIGQTIILTGNQATLFVRNLLPPNVGGELSRTLNVAGTLSSVTSPKIAMVPNLRTSGALSTTDTLKSFSPTAVQAYAAWRPEYQKQFNDCLNANQGTADSCYKSALNAAFKAGAAPSSGNLVTTSGYTNISLVALTLMQIFSLTVLVLTFLVVVIFMLVRIPALWLLLAVSSTAWFTKALPNSEWFGKWWKQFIAWNVFSPLYLFMVYIGIFILQQQGQLTASLADANGNIPPMMATVANMMFLFITGAIFVGGTQTILKASFMSGTWASTALSGITERLGFDKELGAVAPALRITQAKAVYESGKAKVLAGKERLGQAGEEISDRYKRYAPRWMQDTTYEEKLAKARQSFGVAGGAAEVGKISAAAVETQRKTLERQFEEPLKAKIAEAELRLKKAQTKEDREVIEEDIKILKDRNNDQLRTVMKQGSQDARLAAGELLMGKSRLSPQELQALGEQYGRISPVAVEGFTKRRDDQLVKEAEKRKYASNEEMEEYMDLIQDNDKAKAFFENAKKGSNMVAAYQLGTARKLVTDGRGRALTFEQALSQDAAKLSNTNMLDVEKFYRDQAKEQAKTSGTPVEKASLMPQEVREAYLKKINTRQSAYNMVMDAKDAEQAQELFTDMVNEAHTEANKVQYKEQLKRGEAISKEYATRIDKDQEAANKIQDRLNGAVPRPRRNQPPANP